jgi:hypothetical protein
VLLPFIQPRLSLFVVRSVKSPEGVSKRRCHDSTETVVRERG